MWGEGFGETRQGLYKAGPHTGRNIHHVVHCVIVVAAQLRGRQAFAVHLKAITEAFRCGGCEGRVHQG
jgi:hypothetical protein